MEKHLDIMGLYERLADGKVFFLLKVAGNNKDVMISIPLQGNAEPVDENAEKIAAGESDTDKLKKEIVRLEDQVAAAKDVINTLLAMDEKQKELFFTIVDANQSVLNDMVDFKNLIEEINDALCNALERVRGAAGHD